MTEPLPSIAREQAKESIARLNRRRRWKIPTHIAAALFSMVAVIPAMVWITDREPPVERLGGRIVPSPAKPGGQVVVEWQTKINRWCPGTVHREITDSKGVLWKITPEPAVYKLEQSGELMRTFALPVAMACGTAFYESTVEYVCNPFHRLYPIVARGPRVEFAVVGCVLPQ